MAMKQFKAESKRLLDLMINSIYTHHEIFLRELISNASDAIDKLYYRTLKDGDTGLNRSDFSIELIPDKDKRTLTIMDNGCGMTAETLKSVTDPFYTTRTTRKVGMGLPLLKMEAEQTGGTFCISSKALSEYPEDHGTEVTAVFNKKHIDYTPLGDVVSSIVTLIQGHPDTDFLFMHTYGNKSETLDTRELRAVLEEVPLNSYEVLKFIEETLRKEENI